MTYQCQVRDLQPWLHLPEKSGTSDVNLPSLSTGQGMSSPFPTMSAQHRHSDAAPLFLVHAWLACG